MNGLKDSYIAHGLDPSILEHDTWYLSRLSQDAAIEVEMYRLGKNDDFSNTRELLRILEKYQLKDTDTFRTSPHFPYLALWDALRKKSEKELRHISDLALEMRLLRNELEDINNPKKIEQNRAILVDLSREFFRHYHIEKAPLRRLVA